MKTTSQPKKPVPVNSKTGLAVKLFGRGFERAIRCQTQPQQLARDLPPEERLCAEIRVNHRLQALALTRSVR
jgi:hypothetical protein